MFEYIVCLKEDTRHQRLIQNHLPHLFDSNLVVDAHQATAAAQAYRSFSDEKKTAFERLRRVSHGLFFVDGHAGTGKAYWAIHVAAMSQLQTEPATDVKVLYLLETSRAVDDLSFKLGRVYNSFNIKKGILRIPSLPHRFRKARAGPNDETAAKNSDFATMLNFTMGFLQQLLRYEKEKPYEYPVSPQGQIWVPQLTPPEPYGVPSLDEAAYAWFLNHRASYHEVHLAATGIRKTIETGDEQRHLPDMQALLEPLYRATISVADIIITTPAAATHKLVGTNFKPTVIIYDQAGKARELSTLVPLGFYNPLLTIFIGDIKQLLPSPSKNPQTEKKYFDALEISTLARVVQKRGIAAHFKVNHRARGRLQDLPSKLFYGGALESSIPQCMAFPYPVQRVRKYLDTLRRHPSEFPRLMVSLFHSAWERIKGTSSWNPVHHAWILAQVESLLSSSWFGGTILIITSHKGASGKYDDAMEDWPARLRKLRYRVTLRTVNTVIGCEADLSFVDIVKPSSYIDDRNKLCTALSKARYGEIIMMNYKMSRQRLGGASNPGEEGHASSQHLCKVYDECDESKQVLRDNKFGEDIKKRVDADERESKLQKLAEGPEVME